RVERPGHEPLDGLGRVRDMLRDGEHARLGREAGIALIETVGAVVEEFFGAAEGFGEVVLGHYGFLDKVSTGGAGSFLLLRKGGGLFFRNVFGLNSTAIELPNFLGFHLASKRAGEFAGLLAQFFIGYKHDWLHSFTHFFRVLTTFLITAILF